MKKKILAALITAAIITIFASCNVGNEPSKPVGQQEQTTASDVTTAPVTEATTVQDSLNPCGTVAFFPKLQVVAENDECVLGCDQEGNVRYFSKDGMTETETGVRLMKLTSFGVFPDGGYYFEIGNIFSFYDSDCNLRGTYDGKGILYCVGQDGNLYYSEGGTIYAVNDPAGEQIGANVITTEDFAEYADPYSSVIYPSACSKDGLMIIQLCDYSADGVPRYIGLDLAEKTLNETGCTNGDIRVIGGKCYLTVKGTGCCVPYVERDGEPLFSMTSEGEEIVSFNENVLLTKLSGEAGGAVLRVYSAESGKLLGKTEIEGDKFFTARAEGKKIKLFLNDGGTLNVYDWKYGEVNLLDERGELDTYFNLPDRANELEKKLEDEYNVRIDTGEEAAQEIQDYSCGLCGDYVKIYKALDTLSQVLDKFPAGTFGKMLDEEVKSYNFILCGELRSNNDYNLGIAGGVANVENHRQVVAVDINTDEQTLAVNFSHEIWHSMESYIDRINWSDWSNAYFQYWSALNPEGFFYAWRYNADIDDSYTSGGVNIEENPDGVYFVDYYGKVNSLEDKARIFENIFTYGDELPFYFDSKPLQEKAGLICATVREAFGFPDSVELWWERGVETHELSYYDKLYGDYEPVAVG